MTVRFYFPRYKSKQSDRTIFCRIYKSGKEININTGCKSNPVYWDKDQQRISLRKIKNPTIKSASKGINKILAAYEEKVFEIASNYRAKNLNASADEIFNELKQYFNKSEKSLFSEYKIFLQEKESKTRGTHQKYKRLEALLKEFESQSNFKFTFEIIDKKFLDKFFRFLTTKKNMINNTAHKNIQFLKVFMIWANENGLTDNSSYKAFKNKFEQNDVIYLTNDELMSLYNLKIEKERLDRVRDLFLFQCFTGVRYSDIENLQSVDLQNGVWKLRTQKTREPIEIPLNSYSQAILAKYSDWDKPLPIISNQKMNKYVKDLCKEAKINSKVKIVKYRGTEREEKVYPKWQVISSHTARRTFISLSLERGMKPDVIMSITGHKTYRMMQRYLKIADKHKKDEMEKAWGSGLRIVK